MLSMDAAADANGTAGELDGTPGADVARD